MLSQLQNKQHTCKLPIDKEETFSRKKEKQNMQLKN